VRKRLGDAEPLIQMQIEAKDKGQLIVVTVRGRIGGESSIEFYRSVKELVSENQDADVIIDFSQVDFIDSSGIGSLVAINSHLVKNGRGLILAGLMDNMLNLIKMTNLTSVLRIVDKVSDVLE
jgi:anti-sigma B factor antagonist